MRTDLWTDEEHDMVERYYPVYGGDLDRWPERIGRSKVSVRAYASKHGIRFARTYGMRSIDDAQAKRLVEAWHIIAERLNADPNKLVGDLCVLRRMGRLER